MLILHNDSIKISKLPKTNSDKTLLVNLEDSFELNNQMNFTDYH